MAQLDYNSGKNFSTYFRYKYRKKEKNQTVENESTQSVLPYSQQRFRLQLLYGLQPAWVLKTSADAVYYDEQQGKQSLGWMISQSIGWKPSSFPLQSDFILVIFIRMIITAVSIRMKRIFFMLSICLLFTEKESGYLSLFDGTYWINYLFLQSWPILIMQIGI